ncbi:MAG: penicillin-binding protein 2, partial [Proteobacteria bacterium]|nr:penicillin-binding protein 2 [Pseudomonadota bacterium]
METNKKRIVIVFVVLTAVFLILLGRAIFLQIFPDERIVKIAKKQYSGKIGLSPKRGDIFDRNGNPLAISMDFESLYADPTLITDKKTAAEILSKEIGLNYSDTLEKISSPGKRFVWLKHLMSPEEAKKLQPLFKKERGLRTIKEPKRVYPNNTLASHIIGFVDRDAKGMDGVERFYDEFIKNTNVEVKYEKDGKNRLIYSNGNMFLSGDSGNTVYLTIDSNLQYLVEKELKQTVENRNAQSGTVIVMNPKTGEILALANYPTYNPNEPGKSNGFNMRNRAISDLFEPGSIFKIFSAGLALKNHAIDLTTKIWGENGRLQLVGGRRPVTIKEAKGHDYGWMTVSELIAKSSNVGAAKLGLMVGENNFFEGVESFGFGNRTDIDLPGEINGIVNKKGGKVTLATAAFGQGISVTAVQVVKGYSIIANGGYDVVPHVVKRIVDEKGNEMQVSLSQKGDQIISTDLAKQLSNMLRSVVEEGTATATDIMGFELAGKTGTAQKASKGGYSADKYAVSFAGFFPASDPQYTMLVLIDEPKGAYFAAVVAVPLFRTIADAIIQNQSVTPKVMPKYEAKKTIQQTIRQEDKKTETVFKPHDPNIVPDLRGMSLRQALSVISNNWNDVNTYG